jgi:hypothetical protein
MEIGMRGVDYGKIFSLNKDIKSKNPFIELDNLSGKYNGEI